MKCYQKWIADGQNGEMGYLSNYEDVRFNPQLLLPEGKTMICLAMSYVPDKSRALSPKGYDIASYALGKDYHDVVKAKLKELSEALQLKVFRTFCDTAPILERYWAQQAGVGWIGRNHQLIIPSSSGTMGGSMFFLGEIIYSDEVDEYSEPMSNRCGECHKCIDNCPTHALSADKPFDARKCLSYLTIEHRGQIPEHYSGVMRDCIYGCDKCQQVCPYNKFAVPTTIPEFFPSEDLCSMTRDDWRKLTVEQYRRLFKGSAVKRAKYEGLMRNINFVNLNDRNNNE
jgi:epoxyqueuosine reductase